MLLTLVSFFGVLVILILAHELGHFFFAKLFKVRVEEFGVFLPPRLLSFKKGETIYSLNAIPFGGFNKLAGEDDPKVPGSLAGKSVPVRFIVLSAGSVMNLVLPFFLLAISFMIPHAEATDTVVVSQVAENSPAAMAGLEINDIIVAVNGTEIHSIDMYSQIIKENYGVPVTISLKNTAGVLSEVNLVPRANPPAGEGATGVALGYATITKYYPIWEAVPKGVVRYWDFLVLYRNGIVETVKGTVPFEVSGPVGIAQATGEVARLGWAPLLQFAALISINLGVVNLLPLPALDGGRNIFVLIEWLRRGKRVSTKVQQVIHGVGFMLLLALIVAISFKDILRIVHGE